jgi:hypothetical protein
MPQLQVLKQSEIPAFAIYDGERDGEAFLLPELMEIEGRMETTDFKTYVRLRYCRPDYQFMLMLVEEWMLDMCIALGHAKRLP